MGDLLINANEVSAEVMCSITDKCRSSRKVIQDVRMTYDDMIRILNGLVNGQSGRVARWIGV